MGKGCGFGMKEHVLMWQERQLGVSGGCEWTSPLLQQRGGECWEVWHAGVCDHVGWKGPLGSSGQPLPAPLGAGPCGVASGSNNMQTLLVAE